MAQRSSGLLAWYEYRSALVQFLFPSISRSFMSTAKPPPLAGDWDGDDWEQPGQWRPSFSAFYDSTFCQALIGHMILEENVFVLWRALPNIRYLLLVFVVVKFEIQLFFNETERKGSPLISGSRMAAVSALGYSWYKDHISADCFTEILHTANCFPLCQTSGQSGAGDCGLKWFPFDTQIKVPSSEL